MGWKYAWWAGYALVVMWVAASAWLAAEGILEARRLRKLIVRATGIRAAPTARAWCGHRGLSSLMLSLAAAKHILPNPWARVTALPFGVLLLWLVWNEFRHTDAADLTAETSDAAAADALLRYSQGDFPGASAYFNALLGHPLQAKAAAQALTWLAKIRSDQDRAADIRPLLDAAKEADPSEPSPYLISASALAWDGRYAEALRLAEKAVELSPDWKVGLTTLAFVEAGAQLPDRSRATAAKVTFDGIDASEIGTCHYYIAMAAHLRGEPGEACAHLEKAIAAEPAGSRYRITAEHALAHIQLLSTRAAAIRSSLALEPTPPESS